MQTFNRLLIVADYYVNTNSFAIHCEYKDKSMLHCNGKCQMMMQLSKAEKNDQKNPEQKLNNKEEISIYNQHHLTLSIPNTTATKQNFCSITQIGNATARTAWAAQQLRYAAKASQNLGLNAHATFSGALAWPMMYPWPQRTTGLVETAFTEMANCCLPILRYFDECDVDVCYEIHPGEDLHDGVSYEMFLDAVEQHRRACLLYDPSHLLLQCLDYLTYIDYSHERIKAFHVKDAEFSPTGKQGVYGGFQSWVNRAGRFRSLGDGQVDFKSIFSKLATYDYKGWAVLEWECCIKSAEQGAKEGAPFIQQHIIQVTQKAFDEFAGTGASEDFYRAILGLK
jgi:sugar phosphate isomerase/epimerase